MDQASLLVNISLFFIIFFFFFFAFNFFIRTRTRYKNLPPTPPYSLPIIGHLHLLKHPVLHRSLHSLSQTYGPIISLNFGSRRIAAISSSSAAEECFTKNDIVLANRPRLLVSKHLGYNYTTVVSSPYGDHWRNLRRIGAIEIFSTNRLNMFLNIRRDEIKRLLCKLSQNSLHDFAKVELKSMFTELTFNITMRMIAGKRYYGDEVNNKEEALQFREIMREIFTLSGAGNLGDFIPILNWIGSQSFEKRIIEIGKRADSFLQGLIEEARGKMGKQNTIIDHLLALQQSQPEYYTDQTIKGFILVMLLAGTDTSAVTLEWAMSNLLNHPNVLNKAKIEFNTKIGNKKLLEEADTSNLPYLQSIISETMRLYPAVPLLLPHYSSDDCVIGGYDLPRDTTVLVNVWAIQRDPKLWEDPECFKPERFEIDDNKNEGYKLMPFGMGRRACPGAALAQRILSLTLGSLIQCFEWKRVGEKEIDMTEGKGLTMPKVVPLEVMCKACPIMENVLSDQFMDDV